MHVIIVTGFPGSGKTSLSRYLSKVINYYHYDYDVELANANGKVENLNNFPKFAIFDAVHFNTERLEMTLKFFSIHKFYIDVIWLNTDKEICRQNILKRNRATIDIEPLNVVYNIPFLRLKYQFGFIEIIDLQEVSHQNWFGRVPFALPIICENYLQEYKN